MAILKLLEITFVFLAFSIVKALFLAQVTEFTVEFPTLDVPEFDFVETGGGCGGFSECLEFIGFVLRNIAIAVIDTVELLFSLTVFFFEFVAVVTDVLFTRIDGVPFYIDLVLFGGYTAALAIALYRAIKSGDAEA